MDASSTNGSQETRRSQEWRPTQDKRLPRAQEAIEKGLQAIRLKNLHDAFALNTANARRLLREHSPPGQDGIESGGDDDMRVDSDNVTYNYVEQPKASPWEPLARLAGAALLATGIGGPLGIAAWNLPEILRALNPRPQPSATQQNVQPDIWSQYELVVGRPKAGESGNAP